GGGPDHRGGGGGGGGGAAAGGGGGGGGGDGCSRSRGGSSAAGDWGSQGDCREVDGPAEAVPGRVQEQDDGVRVPQRHDADGPARGGQAQAQGQGARAAGGSTYLDATQRGLTGADCAGEHPTIPPRDTDVREPDALAADEQAGRRPDSAPLSLSPP